MKHTATKIKETISQIVQLEAVERHYDATIEHLRQVVSKKDTIEDRLVKELEDISKLERMSIKSMFHKVLGNREEELEKERQEYLKVTLEHKDVLNSIEVAQFEIDVLKKKVLNLDQLRTALDVLKAEREEEIRSTPGALKDHLFEIYNKMDIRNRNIAELSEADLAAKQALTSLSLIHQNMKKAKDWGNMDMLSGKGNRYHKSMKHNSIDRAMSEMSRTQIYLRNLNNELADIGYESNRISLQIDSINRFPGVIFDNLISDWIVQNKIKSVLSTIDNLIDDIQLIRKSMVREATQQNEIAESLQLQKDQLLENN